MEKNSEQKKQNLEALLRAIVTELVMDKDSVKITSEGEGGEITYHLSVAPDDMGRVIGKNGRIAKSMRTIMRVGANRESLKVNVEIDE